MENKKNPNTEEIKEDEKISDSDKENEDTAENTDKNNNTEQDYEKDNRSLGDKIEDTLDDVVSNTHEFFYGPSDNFNEDIPAFIERPSGIKKLNKVQTRRNISKRMLSGNGKKYFLIAMLIVFIIGLIVHFIG